MKRSRLVLVPVSIAMSIGLLAGCGGGESPGGTTSGSASSADTAAKAEAPKEGDKIAGTELAGRMLTALQDAGTMRIATETNGSEVSTADVVYEGNSSSTHATMNAGGQSMEVIALNNGSEVFLKAPSMGVAEWTKVEAGSDNPMIQTMATTLESMKSMMDPAGGLKIYEQAGDFTVGGKKEINGVETTQYSGTLPMEAILDQLGPQGEAIKGQVGTDPVAIEMYLDKDNRPIQIVQNMAVAGQPVSTTLTYSDFGADITVAAP